MIINSSASTGLIAWVENINTKEKFTVSTARNYYGFYETAVIRTPDSIISKIQRGEPVNLEDCGPWNAENIIYVVNSSTFQEAEQKHNKTAEAFEQENITELIKKYKTEFNVGSQLFLREENSSEDSQNTKKEQIIILKKRMSDSALVIVTGIYSRLKKSYSANLDSDFSEKLAAAVINELIFYTSDDQTNRTFSDNNQQLIKEKINDLRQNEEIKYALTQALQVIAALQTHDDNNPIKMYEKWNNNFKKSIERGVFIEGSDMPMPETFFSFAAKFYRSGPELE